MRAAIEQSKPASVILRTYRKDGQMFWNQLRLTVVEAVVKVGRALNADVTAEGVEMASEASSLRGLGCPLGQGFLFSRPLPEKEFLDLLRAGWPIGEPTYAMPSTNQVTLIAPERCGRPI